MWHIDNAEKINIGLYDSPTALPHEHNFLELAYVMRGKARHFMNGEEIIINKGNYFIVDYKTVHSYEKTGDEPLQIMNCLFFPGFIDKTLRECRKFNEVMENYLIHYSYKSTNVNPANRIFFDESREVHDLLIKMHGEYINKKIGYIEVLRCLLIEIFICTMRRVQEENLIYNSIERYITDYVNENYMKKITLSEIASQLNYSLPYLSKTFKESCGMSFESFLQKTRIEQSCRLLANTDKKIIDIAECVGYTDLKFFTSIFKKFTNMPPREYRKLYK